MDSETEMEKVRARASCFMLPVGCGRWGALVPFVSSGSQTLAGYTILSFMCRPLQPWLTACVVVVFLLGTNSLHLTLPSGAACCWISIMQQYINGVKNTTRKALWECRPPSRQTASVVTSDGMYGSPPKLNHLFLVPLRTFPENVIQSVHNFLSYVANRQTDRQTKKLWRKHYLLGGGNY